MNSGRTIEKGLFKKFNWLSEVVTVSLCVTTEDTEDQTIPWHDLNLRYKINACLSVTLTRQYYWYMSEGGFQ